jgi:hypothetical protein
MGDGTSEIREEIEETRLRVGEEVDALSYKTDVGARLDDYVDEKKEAVTSKVVGAKDAVVSAVGSVGSVVPSGDAVGQRSRRVRRMVRSTPIGMGVGAAAVGFVAGLLVPSTRLEDEHLGDVSARVKETASEAGQDALERGRDVARSAMDTVKEEGAQEGRELASDLKDRFKQETETEGSFQ